jgi:Tol biopolymer transport system component
MVDYQFDSLDLSKLHRFVSRANRETLVPILLLLTVFLIAACQTQPNQIFIEVDGGRQSLTTEATTVRAALAEANIVLEPLDKVNPDLYVQLEAGMVIVVIRVTEEVELERQIVPFEKQTIVNEALPPGETRLAQLGVNGEEEISIRVVYEDGQEVSRTEVSRTTVIEPVPEILVVGPQDELPPTLFEGTIAYLSNGNAWLMRDSSGSRRALTTEGKLDGRVFSLSPNGRQLIYTQKLTDDLDLPLNELWLASTTIVGEKPITLGLQGVLHAEWSPVVTRSLIAYSTAERTASLPGWRANNDLWLLAMSQKNGQGPKETVSKPIELIEANTQGLYPWWGATFTWSPDGTKLAYARPDQIGIINLTFGDTMTATQTPLLDFVPLETFSDWVWVPGLSWSPDSRFIAATVHGPPLASEPPAESQVFDLWLFSIDGTISARVAEQVGMWANPVWGEAGIAFGEAINPLQSVTSRYTIQLIDRDGSNKHRLFPFQDQTGVQFPDLAWAPTEHTLLFVYNGDLYTTGSRGSPPRQLTVNSQVSHPQWVPQMDDSQQMAQAPLITNTTTMTASDTITAAQPITVTMTATPSLTISTPVPDATIDSTSIQPIDTTTATLDIEDFKDKRTP